MSALTLLMRASVDLEQLLFTALKPLIMQAAARDVRLLVDAVADFPKTVQVDGLKLAWAATALVGNALRFVRTGSTLMPGGSVVVKIAWEAPEALIRVTDDGPGMPPAVRERLLDRRFDAGRVPALQLLMIEDIVRAHGGTLAIECPAGGGTAVTLRVPCP